jgi:hypothetical protein
MLIKDEVAGSRPGVQAPGAEVFAGFETHRVSGCAVRAIVCNGHVG